MNILKYRNIIYCTRQSVTITFWQTKHLRRFLFYWIRQILCKFSLSLNHFLLEEFEDIKGVIRIHKSRKNRQHNGQKKKDKQWSTKHTHKTKDRATRTPLKTRGELRCSGRVDSSCSTSGTRRVNLVTKPVISHEWGKAQEVNRQQSI